MWVHYESPYGFDVHFDVTIRQGGGLFSRGEAVYAERLGDRSDLKYFNGTWRVQGPWRYHNTDYVYQQGFAELEKGPAVITLSKNTEGKYTAARIVDLVSSFTRCSHSLVPHHPVNANPPPSSMKR